MIFVQADHPNSPHFLQAPSCHRDALPNGCRATVSVQPRNARAMPTMLIERIRAAIAGTPHEFWPKIVAQHAQAGAWELCEALTVLRELQEPTPCGAPPQARWRLPPRTR